MGRTAKPTSLGSILAGSFWVKDIPISAGTALQGHVQCMMLIVLSFFSGAFHTKPRLICTVETTKAPRWLRPIKLIPHPLQPPGGNHAGAEGDAGHSATHPGSSMCSRATAALAVCRRPWVCWSCRWRCCRRSSSTRLLSSSCRFSVLAACCVLRRLRHRVSSCGTATGTLTPRQDSHETHAKE